MMERKRKHLCLIWAICLAAGILCGCVREGSSRDGSLAANRQEKAQSQQSEAKNQQSEAQSKQDEGVLGRNPSANAGMDEAAAQERPGEFEENWNSCFAYDSLTDAEKIWYRDINATLGGMLEKQELSKEGFAGGLNEKCIDKIFQCVLSDHPEYFYVEGYTYTRFTRQEKTVKLEFSGTYSMDADTARDRKGRIAEAADKIIEEAPQGTDDYEKIRYVYETLIRNTEYDLNAPDNQNIYSVFVNRKSVCQGYAKATQYLLQKMGIECTLVTGTVDTGEGHAWNLVKSGGDYYYVDTTWGDASYLQEEKRQEESLNIPQINYDYLCITTDQLLRTHTLGSVAALPKCQAMTDNYYVREGAYFEEADTDRLKTVFEQAFAGGRTDVTIKCAGQPVYEELYRILIAEQKIFEYLGGKNDSVAYAQNEKQLSMTFWMTNE